MIYLRDFEVMHRIGNGRMMRITVNGVDSPMKAIEVARESIPVPIHRLGAAVVSKPRPHTKAHRKTYAPCTACGCRRHPEVECPDYKW